MMTDGCVETVTIMDAQAVSSPPLPFFIEWDDPALRPDRMLASHDKQDFVSHVLHHVCVSVQEQSRRVWWCPEYLEPFCLYRLPPVEMPQTKCLSCMVFI